MVPLEVFLSLHPSILLASAPAALVGRDVCVTAQLQGPTQCSGTNLGSVTLPGPQPAAPLRGVGSWVLCPGGPGEMVTASPS